jgi:hypothetical protein
VGGVIAYRRLMPLLELRLRTVTPYNDRPLVLMNGVILDPDLPYHQVLQQEFSLQQPRLPGDKTPQVEIIGPSERSIINWIAEAEQKLHSDGWIQP